MIGLADLFMFLFGPCWSKARHGVAEQGTRALMNGEMRRPNHQAMMTKQASNTDKADETSKANTTDTTDDTWLTKMTQTMSRPKTQ